MLGKIEGTSQLVNCVCSCLWREHKHSPIDDSTMSLRSFFTTHLSTDQRIVFVPGAQTQSVGQLTPTKNTNTGNRPKRISWLFEFKWSTILFKEAEFNKHKQSHTQLRTFVALKVTLFATRSHRSIPNTAQLSSVLKNKVLKKSKKSSF